MSEQIVDLRSVWAILRRHTGLLVAASALGGLAGGAAFQTLPPVYSSTTMVLFPATSASTAAQATAHAIETQAEIASSETVFARAGKLTRSRPTASQVADLVTVEAPTDDVLTITARGATAAEAEQLATAVANADVDYLQEIATPPAKDERASIDKRRSTLAGSLAAVQDQLARTTSRLRAEGASSAPGKTDAVALAQLTARQADLVLQIDAIDRQLASQTTTDTAPATGPRLVGPASPARTLSPIARGATFVGAGAALAFAVVAALMILRGRREKALRSRDQIADSIGVPVVASLASRPPRSVAGWVSLLRGYDPESTEAWALRQVMRRFASGVPEPLPGAATRTRRIVVLTLSGDQAALTFAAQLASFAAATGVRTQLVVGSKSQESTSSLRAACSRVGGDDELRPGLFVDSGSDAPTRGDLVVQTLTVSRQQPGIQLAPGEHAVALLAVSSGAATGEDLARVALAADDAGVPLRGIVVANPDPLDRTTGRLLPTQRALLAPLPSLMTGPVDHDDDPPGSAARRRQG
ncbi:Wzz/FepE/Etk N-terminal domain-containing protein [Intrasporangium sp. YIM S08009]|uniref:Wzz/FepE/Etk N-terminal domain-containing protein n=1 Tax=Intrasporangium zincisolvens TaxID=3080018 RepID=UPI002B05B3A2|nr:Wzz/FepE/Etk N-terminal domain-containing protein [Intrasporangium sp. YIM S08009]